MQTKNVKGIMLVLLNIFMLLMFKKRLKATVAVSKETQYESSHFDKFSECLIHISEITRRTLIFKLSHVCNLVSTHS